MINLDRADDEFELGVARVMVELEVVDGWINRRITSYSW
jgi:hypothetical protein